MKIRANHEGQTLENKVAVDIQEATQAIGQLETGIKSLKSTINSIAKNTGISAITNQVNQAKKSTSVWSKTWSAVQKTINFSAIYLGAKQVLSTLKEMTDASVDYTETVNLFNVSFGKGLEGLNQYYEQALEFQEKLEEKLGVNIEESMRYQALFNSMTKSMGLGANYAYTLSENMTKLGYDLASLYNIDPESAMTKLRAGLAGQTEPLRELGLDITEQSLKPVAESLGITESIRNMSQAEKTVLRYITVLRQAQIAQGDFARTMDSPANQLRIFNAQVTAFKRNMGNLWQGMLGGILPYINAVMMVINELLKMVAKLFGFEVSSQPVNVSASIGADDLADDLGTAGKKAKELKAQLMGFDEINNISLNNDTSSGGSTEVSGTGIDQRLLDALTGYDNMMDSISNKATELRDKMLAWLGFERDDDGTWKLKEGLTNFEKILDVAKTIGFAIGTWKISSAVTNLLKNLGVLKGKQNFQLAFGLTLSLTGLFAQYQGTKHLLNGDVDLFTILETLLGTAGGAFGIVSILKATKLGKTLSLGNKLKVGFGIMLGIQGVQVFLDGISKGDIKKTILGAFEGITSLSIAFKTLFGNNLTSKIKNTANNVKSFASKISQSFKDARKSGSNLAQSFATAGQEALNLIPKSVRVVGGLTGLVTTTVTAYNAMAGLRDGSKSASEALGELAGSVAGAIGSGAMIGSVFGPVGTLVGGLTGLVLSGGSAWLGYSEDISNAKEKVSEMSQEIENSKQAYENQLKAIEDNQKAQEVEIDFVGKLKDELTGLVDENGKVKKGYEDRVDYILGELNEALGTEYTRTGDVIENYKEMITTIDDLIEEKKRKIKLEAQEEKYKESLKEQQEIEKKLKEAIEDRNNLYDEWVEKQNSAKNIFDIFEANALADQVKEANENVKTLEDNLTTASQNVMDAEYSMLENTVAGMDEITDETLEKNEDVFDALVTSADEYTAEFVEKLQTLNTETRAQLLGQLDTITATKPEIIEEWRRLAEDSMTDFKKGISTMPTDVQGTILASITTADNLNEEMIKIWNELATSSVTDFNNALSILPEDVQGTILASITKTEGLTDKTKQAWISLASKSETAYNEALKDLPNDTKEKIQSAVNAVNGKQKSMETSGGNLAEAGIDGANQKTKDSKTGIKSVGEWFVQGFKNAISGNSALNTIWNAGWNLVSAALNGGNARQETGSPAKKTIEMGNFYTEGYILGIKKKIPEAKKVAESLVGVALKELNEVNKSGFNISSKELSIDASQFIDYGSIAGNINTKTNIEMTNLPEQVRQAVIEGMKNARVQVDIEARTDKGVMFKAMQEEADDFAVRTGENPFPVMI